MKKTCVILTDIHGMWYTLETLLDKVEGYLAGKPYQIYLLGDLIDRGPHSRQVVEWAMEKNILCVFGNHESLCVDYHQNQLQGERSDYPTGQWFHNGANETLKSWSEKAVKTKKLPTRVIQWMAEMPLYIIPPDYPELLLSHTGHISFDPDAQGSAFDSVWMRGDSFPKDGRYRVFGHTSTLNPIITDSYAQIDTGAAYGGRLTALLYPTMEIIDQRAID